MSLRVAAYEQHRNRPPGGEVYDLYCHQPPGVLISSSEELIWRLSVFCLWVGLDHRTVPSCCSHRGVLQSHFIHVTLSLPQDSLLCPETSFGPTGVFYLDPATRGGRRSESALMRGALVSIHFCADLCIKSVFLFKYLGECKLFIPPPPALPVPAVLVLHPQADWDVFKH